MTRTGTSITSRLEDATVAGYPYPHIVVDAIFDQDDADRLLSWLETEASWWTQERDFYQHESCDNLEACASTPSGAAISKDARRQMAVVLGEIFGVDLDGEHATVAAHRMVAGQGVGLHTDDPSLGTEALRCVVTLQRGAYSDEHGGHLLLFSDHDVDAVSTIIRPLHNSGVAFPLSGESVHAVNDVTEGVRYSVVLGFWDRSRMGSAQVPEARRRAVRPETDLARVPAAADVIAFLGRAGARSVAHSGGTLLDHLVGVAAILADWECDRDLCLAGLLHSIYGTASFDEQMFGEADRTRIASVAGRRAEQLAWLFSTVRFGEVYRRAGGDGNYEARLRDGGTTSLAPADVCDLNLLACANLFEQAPAMMLGPNEVYEWRHILERLGPDLPPLAQAQLNEVFGATASDLAR
jgi:2OG-Fe(II) oxygenase superfamily